MIQNKSEFLDLINYHKTDQRWCVVIYIDGNWDFYKGCPPQYVYDEKNIDFGVFTMGQLTTGIIDAIESAIDGEGSIFEIERVLNDD